MKIYWRTIALFIPILCYVLNSCSRDSDDVNLTKSSLWGEYIEDYSNITCRNEAYYNNDSVLFSGVKKGHLWYAIFSKSSKKKIFEWEDKITIDTANFQIYKGYGEYVYAKIENITPSFYKKNENGEIVSMRLNFSTSFYPPISYITSFTNREEAIHQFGTYWRSWYNGSVVLREFSAIDEAVYPTITLFPFYKVCDIEGNLLFKYDNSFRNLPVSVSELFSTVVEPISNTEAICRFGYNLMRWNYDMVKDKWQKRIYVPFEVPADANPKYTYILLDKSTNNWRYKVDMTYFDGTKKDFSFTINIDTGEISYIF